MSDISDEIAEKEEMFIRSNLESAMSGMLGEGSIKHKIEISIQEPDREPLRRRVAHAVGYAIDYMKAFLRGNSRSVDDVRYNIAEIKAEMHKQSIKDAAKEIYGQHKG